MYLSNVKCKPGGGGAQNIDMEKCYIKNQKKHTPPIFEMTVICPL